ncbi:MAG: type II toxin-antitoxin system VapC family toxin [Blastocatellia bacterium]
MSEIVLLDSSPLGLASNPTVSPATDQCNQWIRVTLRRGALVHVPEIADYEVRRELIRAGKIKGIAKLNELKRSLGFLRINSWMMLKAAEFWAQSRRQGRQTSSDASLDADMILAAQATFLQDKGHTVIVATTNVKHLELFVDARKWEDIT